MAFEVILFLFKKCHRTHSVAWFQYPGSNGWYEWLAYDDAESEYAKAKTPISSPEANPVKTMIVTVGESPILISNFTYKAFSQY